MRSVEHLHYNTTQNMLKNVPETSQAHDKRNGLKEWRAKNVRHHTGHEGDSAAQTAGKYASLQSGSGASTKQNKKQRCQVARGFFCGKGPYRHVT